MRDAGLGLHARVPSIFAGESPAAIESFFSYFNKATAWQIHTLDAQSGKLAGIVSYKKRLRH